MVTIQLEEGTSHPIITARKMISLDRPRQRHALLDFFSTLFNSFTGSLKFLSKSLPTFTNPLFSGYQLVLHQPASNFYLSLSNSSGCSSRSRRLGGQAWLFHYVNTTRFLLQLLESESATLASCLRHHYREPKTATHSPKRKLGM